MRVCVPWRRAGGGTGRRGTEQRHVGIASHEDWQQQFELGMRQHNKEMLQWGMRYAVQHADAFPQDLQQRLATVQQRVHDAAAMVAQVAVHPDCTASADVARTVAAVGWRRIILHVLVGAGVISMPTIK